MPELPDVEVYRRNLLSRLRGKVVREAHVHRPKRTPDEAELQRAIIGSKLTDIVRDGKVLRFVFDNGNVLVVHLMLNGEFQAGPDLASLPAKKVSLRFDDFGYLSISDFSGLAQISLNTPPSKAPDARDQRFDCEYLQRALDRFATKPVKSVLTDQNVVQGIGNKYSDEILWAAAIAPQSLSGRIPPDAVRRLHGAIKTLLADATESVHANHPDAINGKMREGLKVHRQAQTPSNSPVAQIMVGDRETFYSPDEQVCYR